ncbi:hypothetical protein J132_09453 [Termitomyces sp. J132]|nr:hypothetical protein J132_09453 [Termitomyces sp. J132]
MSAFNPTYNPINYPTDAYGRPLLENPYAPFYPGPFVDQYVPCHWTPDPNQAFYAPSISQGILPGWHRPPAFHANGNNPHINPGGYSAAPPNPTYLPPAHYYVYPIPAAAPVPPEAMDNYSPPHPLFAAQTPPSPRQQRVEAYAQQHDKVLCFLCLSPVEFARHSPPVPRGICKAYPHPPHQPRLPQCLCNSRGLGGSTPQLPQTLPARKPPGEYARHPGHRRQLTERAPRLGQRNPH